MPGADRMSRDRTALARWASGRAPLGPPMDRGRLLSPKQVVSEHFPEGTLPVKNPVRWVKRHFPRWVKLSPKIWLAYEYDVREWLQNLRPEDAA